MRGSWVIGRGARCSQSCAESWCAVFENAAPAHGGRQHGREVRHTRLVSNDRGLRLTTLAGAEPYKAAAGHYALMAGDT